MDDLWDRGPWDLTPGEDFGQGVAGQGVPRDDVDEWRSWAVHMKAIAKLLGGSGHAAEIVHRNRAGEITGRTFRWQYIAWGHGWRGTL